MTQQHIEDIIKLKAYLVVRAKDTIYLLDKERIGEIARMIVEGIENESKGNTENIR